MAVSTGSPNDDYIVIAALIAAIPATFGALANWRATKKNRREESEDHSGVELQLATLTETVYGVVGEVREARAGIRENLAGIAETRADIAEVNLAIDRQSTAIELRFDSIEDVTERHLGWHRVQAENDLEEALKKESTSDNPYTIARRPDPDTNAAS